MIKENIGGFIMIFSVSFVFVAVFSYFFSVPWWACVLFLLMCFNIVILLDISSDLADIKYSRLSDIKQDIEKLKNKH